MRLAIAIVHQANRAPLEIVVVPPFKRPTAFFSAHLNAARVQSEDASVKFGVRSRLLIVEIAKSAEARFVHHEATLMLVCKNLLIGSLFFRRLVGCTNSERR